MDRIWTRSVDLSQQLAALDAKLERMWLDLDFIRTHLSSYLGDGVALTYLADATPIYVNSDDCGGPSNLLNGGRYEEENLEVLLSFIKEDTVFLDIGANLGFFTLQVGKRILRRGKIYSFEPHPKLHSLLRWNVHLNGLTSTVDCFSYGLSDQNAPAKFAYPIGHLGGGSVGDVPDNVDFEIVASEIRRLDDVLGPDFSCDLVKIDVEGHELNVLNGMRRIVANSPDIKILFEKLSPNLGTEQALEKYFHDDGFELYHVGEGSSLGKIVPGSLKACSGYLLAARCGAIEESAQGRSRFCVYPGQLTVRSQRPAGSQNLAQEGRIGEILFHGPYWFLRKGVWRLKLHGAIRGAISFSLQERFGYHVMSFPMNEGQSEHVFILKRNLIHFECVARPTTDGAGIELDRLEFIREG